MVCSNASITIVTRVLCKQCKLEEIECQLQAEHVSGRSAPRVWAEIKPFFVASHQARELPRELPQEFGSGLASVVSAIWVGGGIPRAGEPQIN